MQNIYVICFGLKPRWIWSLIFQWGGTISGACWSKGRLGKVYHTPNAHIKVVKSASFNRERILLNLLTCGLVDLVQRPLPQQGPESVSPHHNIGLHLHLGCKPKQITKLSCIYCVCTVSLIRELTLLHALYAVWFILSGLFKNDFEVHIVSGCVE